MANFSTNLQYRRMDSGMTQEQLAEKMGVSRQTVSKWESGASYPEMEKLIALCSLFHCTLDELVRGGLPAPAPEQQESEQETPYPQAQRADYERVMSRTAWGIAVGAAMIIAGVAVNLFFEAAGMLEAWGDIALFLMLAAGLIVLIVSGSGRGRFRRKHPVLENFYSEAEQERQDRRFPFGIGAGVGLILLGICAETLHEAIAAPFGWSEAFFDGAFLLLAALGVGVLILNGLKKDQYNIAKYNRENTEDPDIPAPDAVSARTKRKNQITGGICGIIMLLATIAFFVTGFVLRAWYVSWIAFPVGGILCAIVNILANIFDRSKGE
ncbi:MAG TPA: helix-turn-helix domain-containing protein [Candidatus Onthovicinus excrementipullorum]|nr:helix-turn-helix domain-containing protein [Candidatus Onthovicinus excrementipullorum]